MKELFEFIYDLITEFDEMGFVPTTTVPEDPEVYAIRWRDAMIEALQDLSKQSEWISVEDRLPPENCRVLVYSPTDGINLGHRLDEVGRFYVTKPYPDHPTHWMPLPEAPKGGAEERNNEADIPTNSFKWDERVHNRGGWDGFCDGY